MTGMFDDFFTRDLSNWGLNNNSTTNTTLPAVNIRESPENYEVEMAAPGMTKDDFKIELDGNQLTISSEIESQQENNEDNKYSRKECYQSFQRIFQLPKEVVDADKIQARYVNGLLQLSIPKKEEAKQRPPRRIEVY
jgi:HSP20 family protein